MICINGIWLSNFILILVSWAKFETNHNGFFWKFLSEKCLIKISILGTKVSEIRKSKGPFIMSILKVDDWLSIFFQISYFLVQKKRIVLNTFWIKNPKSSHCETGKKLFEIFIRCIHKRGQQKRKI